MSDRHSDSRPRAADQPLGTARFRRLAAVIVLMVVFASGMLVDRIAFDVGPSAGASSSVTDHPEFQSLQDTWDLIHDHYVDTAAIDDRALLYGAAKGMVETLGDSGHSAFLDPEEAEAFSSLSTGSFIGIGIQLDFRDGRPVIVSPIDGSPADLAGIRPRDVIAAIDGESTDGMSEARVSDLLQGEVGTDVTLTLERPTTGERRTVTLTRAEITIEPVSWGMLPGRTGWIRLAEFSIGATDDVREALDELNKTGATSLVLDLRDNPGGLVSEAIGVASEFMPEGTTIFLEQQRDAEPLPIKTLGRGRWLDKPMAVLVNGGSASAAEIVGGALRDNDRAMLLGERTFGTGTVLLPFPLDDGSVVLLGTGLWLTADGEQLWHKGVEPDRVIELPPTADPLRPADDDSVTAAELRKSGDVQLGEAVEAASEAADLAESSSNRER